jgi:hypothetical protein
MRQNKSAVGFVAQAAVASAVMTVSQHIEIALTHRSESDQPVRIIERLTHRTVPSGPARVVAGQMVQGVLAATAVIFARSMARVPAVAAIAIDALALSVTNAAVAQKVNEGGMPWTWSGQELATDLTHKTSLATAAILLTRR